MYYSVSCVLEYLEVITNKGGKRIYEMYDREIKRIYCFAKMNIHKRMSFQIKILWLFLMIMILSGAIFATFYGILKNDV